MNTEQNYRKIVSVHICQSKRTTKTTQKTAQNPLDLGIISALVSHTEMYKIMMYNIVTYIKQKVRITTWILNVDEGMPVVL